MGKPTSYKFSIYPMSGKPGALPPQTPIELTLRTEKEFHGVWFNCGAIASQPVLARQFQNKVPANPTIRTTRKPLAVAEPVGGVPCFINGTKGRPLARGSTSSFTSRYLTP